MHKRADAVVLEIHSQRFDGLALILLLHSAQLPHQSDEDSLQGARPHKGTDVLQDPDDENEVLRAAEVSLVNEKGDDWLHDPDVDHGDNVKREENADEELAFITLQVAVLTEQLLKLKGKH